MRFCELLPLGDAVAGAFGRWNIMFFGLVGSVFALDF
jgi:hypothetical protein